METVVQSLLQACALGDPNLLASCLQYGLDLNFVTEDGLTLLIYAITYAGSNPRGEYYQVIEMLLQAGIHPESVDTTYGRTSAHWAAICKQGDILRLLLAAGCNVAMYDLEGLTPFHLAISNNLQHCVEEIVAASPDIIHLPTLSGLMPLMLAAYTGSIRLCQLFLGHGCDPNVINENTFQSALHMAAERGHSPIVGLLIKKQAILDAVDFRGVTPVHLASSLPTSDVLATICDIVGSAVLELTDASGLTPLMHACVNGSEDCVDFIVKKKVKLLAKDSNEGKTCLHWASESTICSPNIVRLLCKKKKQLIDDKDAYGRTPLHLAVISGHTEALKVLLDSGCDFSLADNNQYTAVHWAVVSGRPGTLQELISHGCSTEDKEKNGATPLHLAAQTSSVSSDDDGQLLGVSEGALQCLNILVSNGASITATDNEGCQPLHWALQCHNNTPAVQILVQEGADPKKATSEGLKSLHVAAKYGITENCRYLIELEGCDANEKDDKGQTALFYSIESNAIDCSTYLLSIGCSANHRNKDKRSPVHIAASIGSIEGLQLLSSYNGDFNAKSIDCLTPLHDAAANGHTGVLKYLLNAGSDPNPSTSPEHTNIASPLHYAVSEGYNECATLLLKAGANVNSYIITEEGTSLTPTDYATEYPDLKDILQSNGGLSGIDIYIEKPENENKEIEDMLVEEAQMQQNLEKQAEVKEKQGNTFEVVLLPTIQSKQPHRDQIDPFDPVDLTIKEHLSRSRVLSCALSLIRQKTPPPDSIKCSIIGLFSAQATMLAGGILGTPLGDKTLEVAGKVATDTAENLTLSAEELDTAPLELEWLQTPEKEPTPLPEPQKSPPTPAPSPRPKFEFHIDSYERRIRKAKAQMDETKSSAFLAMEELLRAQSTQAHLKRQFVMAQVKEECNIKRDKFKKEEARENAKALSNQALSQYQERIDKAKSTSEEVDSLFRKQIGNAHQINCEVTASMRQLGISTRATVSEWLKKKQEQKNNHLKSTLHNWHRSKQQREVAISIKQAVTSHRALQHVAWGVKKDLSAQLQGLNKPKHTTETGKKKSIISELESTYVQSNVPFSKRESTTYRTITSNGCIRATPFALVKRGEPSPPPKGIHRSYSLPDSTLWEMGQCYVGGVKTFYSGIHHRAYGPKTVHAERTLHFVFPNQHKKTKQCRASCSPNPIALSQYPGQHFNPNSTVLYHSMADQFPHKCQKDSVQLAKLDLPMKVIDEPTIVKKITA